METIYPLPDLQERYLHHHKAKGSKVATINHHTFSFALLERFLDESGIKATSNALSSEVMQRFGIQPPVDVEAIAKDCGIDVRLENLEDEVSGMLVVREGSAVIGVNARHHVNRRRFTIAHELGHFLLHRDDARFFIDAAPVFYRSDQTATISRDQELAANGFAAELLLPESSLSDSMRSDPIDIFDDIAVKRLAIMAMSSCGDRSWMAHC